MPVESTFLEAGGLQHVLHGTSGHAALVEQWSGLLDDALPGLLSFAHGLFQVSKKRRIGLFSAESIQQRNCPVILRLFASAVSRSKSCEGKTWQPAWPHRLELPREQRSIPGSWLLR